MLTKLTQKEFDKVYQLMETSFPKDEYRPYAEQKALLEKSNYTIYGMLCSDTQDVQGFIAVWDFEDIAFVEHFAVNPNYRNGGLGSKILGELSALLEKQICLEVELPDTEMAGRRIGFYQRNGFVLNDYEYMQPAISAGRTPIPLRIMTLGSAVDGQTFCKIKALLYTYVYQQPVEPECK